MMLSCFGVVCFFFELYLCFFSLVCFRLYLVICVLFRVCVRYFSISVHWEFLILICFGFRIVLGSVCAMS